jgi:hypothetical protein
MCGIDVPTEVYERPSRYLKTNSTYLDRSFWRASETMSSFTVGPYV